jgi:hypothetical protein
MASARDLVVTAAGALNDPRGEYWDLSELLDYYNLGLKEMVKYVPDQFKVVSDVALVAGSKQTLPERGVRLVQPLYSGSQPVRRVSMTALDAVDPGWRVAAAGTPREVAYDAANPLVYWVSPPASAGAPLTIEYAREPDDQEMDDVAPVSSVYEAALVDYIMSRAYAKDAEYAGQGGRAAAHYASFLGAVGGAAK